MPFHDFWKLPVSEFSNVHDFVVRAKRFLSVFITEEKVIAAADSSAITTYKKYYHQMPRCS